VAVVLVYRQQMNESNTGKNGPSGSIKMFVGYRKKIESSVYECFSPRQVAEEDWCTTQNITAHVACTYKSGVDVLQAIENRVVEEWAMPKNLTTGESESNTEVTMLENEVELEQLCEKFQYQKYSSDKVYVLVYGQCSELIKSKLKSVRNYGAKSEGYDLLGWLEGIKSIMFLFQGQQQQNHALASLGCYIISMTGLFKNSKPPCAWLITMKDSSCIVGLRPFAKPMKWEDQVVTQLL
jgi:hypothetical protein